MIPVGEITGDNFSERIDSMFSYYDNLLGHKAKASSLNYAADHFRDKERAKEYTKIIADTWNIPEEEIIHEVYQVIFMVKFLMINDVYEISKKKYIEEQTELFKIHNLINKIEAGSVNTLEITLKATGKGVSSDVQLKSDATVRIIFEYLKMLPKAKIKPRSKGRQPGVTPEIQVQRNCAAKIKETYSSQFKSKNKLYEFIGYIFVAAGIYQTDDDYKIEYSNSGKYDSFRDYLISKIKSLIG
jgi:hypothetical protein